MMLDLFLEDVASVDAMMVVVDGDVGVSFWKSFWVAPQFSAAAGTDIEGEAGRLVANHGVGVIWLVVCSRAGGFSSWAVNGHASREA